MSGGETTELDGVTERMKTFSVKKESLNDRENKGSIE